MFNIELWTDGACRRNGQPDAIGAWGWVMLVNEQKLREDAGMEPDLLTNNQNELYAVIQSLESIQPQEGVGPHLSIQIHADSAYVVNAINKNWLTGWAKKGWKTAQNKPVLNKELWLQLIVNLERLTHLGAQITFVKVKGHAGVEWNEYVDALINGVMDTGISRLATS